MPELALSIRQPWAFLVARGVKPIENRSWTTSFRGRICIHAGVRADDKEGYEVARTLLIRQIGKDEAQRIWESPPRRWFGCLIGEVDIVDVVNHNTVIPADRPWFFGPFGFVLANAQLYEKPLWHMGKLGLFKVKMGARKE